MRGDDKFFSRAVVAGDGSDGMVIWHSGKAIKIEIDGCGSSSTEELRLGVPGIGLFVWEGTYRDSVGASIADYEYPELHGKFRAPTDNEWRAIREGRNPWDVGAQKRDYYVTVCASCKMACCWHSVHMCSNASAAGTVELLASELDRMGLEHPCNYSRETLMRICGEVKESKP